MKKRTTLILPDGLLEKVHRLSGKSTKTEAVAEALVAYVTRKGIDKLIAARGTFQIEDMSRYRRRDWRRRTRLLE